MKRGRQTRRPRSHATRDRVIAGMVVAGLLIVLALALAGRGGDVQGGEAVIHIAPGASASQIAQMLADENVIDDQGDFMKKAEDSGSAGQLKAGTYRFQRGEPIDSILSKLEQGLQDPQSVLTIPEGYSLADIASLVASKTGISAADYKSAAQAAGKQMPIGGAGAAVNLEGFLFPSTYNIDSGMTAESLVGQQLSAFKEETGSLWSGAGSNPATQGLTPYQILTVASMVEREAKVPEERPLIAAVIYNRIAAGMKLEVDATVQYALGYWKQDLTESDLQVDSPYNTRLYGGLPPGPICNPGVDSIRAALNPAPVNYLYYVAKGDPAGHHFFTASYEEFLQAKAGAGG